MYNKLLYATISSRGKEAVRRLSHRLSSKPLAAPFLQTRNVVVRPQREPSLRKEFPLTKSAFSAYFITNTRGFRSHSSAQTREGWVAWLGKKKKTIAVVIICMLALRYFTSEKSDLPHVVTAGAPVLHQPAREVYPGEIGSARIEKVIDDMVKVMRKKFLVSLVSYLPPQIGVPFKSCSFLLFCETPYLKEQEQPKTALFSDDCVKVEFNGLVDSWMAWLRILKPRVVIILDGIYSPMYDKMEKGTFEAVA
ncbi:peptide deformylase 1A, chloroplastic-like protein [Tanacetum coccineum]